MEMEKELLEAFSTSTVSVLSSAAHILPKTGQPIVKLGNNTPGDISSVIGITGQISGWISLSFQKGIALKIVSNMLGEEKSSLDPDVQDAVGEIINMVAGNAKAILSNKGKSFKLALPTVIIGENHVVNQKKNNTCLLVPFSTRDGNFHLEICVRTEEETANG